MFYLPLEGYKERYTLQWSAPKTGWLERNWTAAGVEYTRIDPPQVGWNDPAAGARQINVGSVVDGVGRSLYTFGQIGRLLGMAEDGLVKDSDVILLDDFWTPGLEALPYAFHLLGIRPRVYAFLHAQSVDEFDFTAAMKKWIRPIERGFGEFLDGIFVCCPTLRDLVVRGGISTWERVHITGHPFSSEEVMERMPADYRAHLAGKDQHGKPLVNSRGDYYDLAPRANKVVWSSRWDREKNPQFFLDLAAKIITDGTVPDAEFVVCTSAPKLRSNDSRLLQALGVAQKRYPGRIVLKEGLTKEAYYAELCTAKVQFNCADQDFVAITLLEASVAGAYPLYPYFRSFPETFLWKMEYLYEHKDLLHACDKLTDVLGRDDLWTREAVRRRSWIHRRFDSSWLRMLDKMGVQVRLDRRTQADSHKDPFGPSQWGE